ncbi:glycosyltransferase family 1 protein [Crassisporium funariophilum]|nr:glycosyltransferase family 1 protein [Crassisporium funariophilum]
MFAFVTVGSTKFDSLIQAVFAEEVLLSLSRQGYTNLVVQCGNSTFDLASTIKDGGSHHLRNAGVDIEFWKFKPSLQEEYEKADLVISHAGSGTILDVLRMGKPMIVVPNPTLLDNHQEELSSALKELGHLKASTVENLPRTIDEFDASNIKPFPPFDGSRFARIVDEAMGFI